MTLGNEYNYESNYKILVRHFMHDDNASSMIKKAYDFALKAHEGQTRKSGEAYVQHPISVALILEQISADYETICAALLHDTIEDVDWVNKELIEKEFGETIADLVDGVTKVAVKESQDKRIQDIKTINKLILSLEHDARIFIIKLADRLHNMSTISGHSDNKKRIRIAQQTLDVYVPIARLLGMYNFKERLEKLCFPIIYPDIYNSIKQLKREQIEENKDLSQLIYDLKYEPSSISLYQLFKEYNIDIDDIEFKFKENYSIYDKLKNKDTNALSQIDDLITYKIKTKSIADVYKVLGVINENYPVLNESEHAMKDYISNPKFNYYRALHSYNIVRYKNHAYQIHFQIQTTGMWRESVDGIASFWNWDIDDSAKLKMQESLESDFPFYHDLTDLCHRYNKREYSDNAFYDKVQKLILPKRINIKTSGYNHVQTYLGCTVKDLIIKLHPNYIDPLMEYYINGEKKDINYVFNDNDMFEEKPKVKEDESFTRKRK